MSDVLASEQPLGTPAALTDPSPGPSWLEQDAKLRDMWLKNQTPQIIAETLGRSVPAVMTRAARLGLPRRAAPGRKPGVRRQEGMGGDTNRVLNRDIQKSSSFTSSHVMPQTSLRVCLMCLNKFESLGRHNRICSTCKGSSEYESASALPELNVPVS